MHASMHKCAWTDDEKKAFCWINQHVCMIIFACLEKKNKDIGAGQKQSLMLRGEKEGL